MTAVVDAGAIIALVDEHDPAHGRVRVALERERGELFIPAPITAEVDYMLGRRFGRVERLTFLDDLAAGRLRVACLDAADHAVVATLERRYEQLDAGLADLSAVVVAGRVGTTRIVTFDERHFRTFRQLQGGHFTLLPADEPDASGE